MKNEFQSSQGKIYFKIENPNASETIVISSGIGQQIAYWTPFIKLLQNKYRVVLFDLPNQGKSFFSKAPLEFEDYINVIDELFEHLKIKDAIGLGVAFGAHVLKELAFKGKGYFSHLILASCFVHKDGKMTRHETNTYVTLKTALEDTDFFRLFGSGWLDASYTQMFGNGYIKLREEEKNQALRKYITGVVSQMETLRNYNTKLNLSSLNRINIPVLVVHGDNDFLIPPGKGKELTKTLKQGEFIRLKHTGHIVQESNPEALAETVVNFLNEH